MTTMEMLSRLRNNVLSVKCNENRYSSLSTKANFSDIKERKNRLLLMIRDDVNQLAHERGKIVQRAYDYIDAVCHIAPPTMKKVMLGQNVITRVFLYKYTVGLRMPLAKAQKYFELQGGVLRSENEEEELIVYNALRDGDDADSLMDEFDRLLGRKL